MIWSVVSNKGGVGKTTTAVNLSAALAELGRRVLLIDLDPRADASTRWLGLGDPEDPGLLHAMAAQGVIKPTASSVPGLDVVIGSRHLARIERLRHTEDVPDDVLYRGLATQLDIIDARDRYDLVIIDCPPSFGVLSTVALVASTGALVPVQGNYLGVEGLADVLRLIGAVRERANPHLVHTRVCITMVNPRTRIASDVEERLSGLFGDDLLLPAIRRGVRLEEAPGFQQTIMQYAPQSRGAQDYRALARAFDTARA